MKRIATSALALATLMLAACTEGKKVCSLDTVASPLGTEVYTDNLDSIAQHYEFPKWYTDAKFGIFIHWGIFSVPAFGSEWYSRNMYQEGSREFEHHRQTYGDQTEFGYKDFIPMFKAEKFDAEQWAQLFEASGARYVIPVAEHHDGFAMYDSELNEWNAKKMGPKRDVLGELKGAIERHKMTFGLSSHRAENAWFFNGGMKFPSDVQDSTIALYGFRYDDQTYTEESSRQWLERTRELVDKYQPRLIFFDWTVNHETIKPYFTKFMAYYYNNAIDWGEGVVVNTKQGYPTNTMVWDVERGKSDQMMQFPWQTDTFVGTKSWGYIEDEVYKVPDQLVDDLVDIVSKNGNLLLNIGPCADGTIPQEQQNLLLAIGQWLKVNGEAIYGSHCWKRFGEGETEVPKGSFSDNKAVAYTAQDIRFTTQGNDLYVIALEWGKQTLVKSLTPDVIGDAKILGVKMLGSDEEISYEQTAEGLLLSFPTQKPCDFAYAFRISLDKMAGENMPSEAVNEVLEHGGGSMTSFDQSYSEIDCAKTAMERQDTTLLDLFYGMGMHDGEDGRSTYRGNFCALDSIPGILRMEKFSLWSIFENGIEAEKERYEASLGIYIDDLFPSAKIAKEVNRLVEAQIVDLFYSGDTPLEYSDYLPTTGKNMLAHYEEYFSLEDQEKHERQHEDTIWWVLPWRVCIVACRLYHGNGLYTYLVENSFDFNGSCGCPSSAFYYTFRKDGSRIGYDDIFKPGVEDKVSRMLMKEYKAAYKKWSGSEPDEGISPKKSELLTKEKVALVKEGVLFYYEPYTIGCGAEGQYNLILKYDDLEGLLK